MAFFEPARAKVKSLCVVGSVRHTLEPSAHQIARWYAQQGWDVTFLDLHEKKKIEKKAHAEPYKKAGARDFMGGRPWYTPQQALAAYHWLKERSFDAILFHAPVAAGFFCCQAQRAGLAFGKTALWVVGDSLGRLYREKHKSLCETPRTEGETDYLEAQTLSLAQGVYFVSEANLSLVQEIGMALPDTVLSGGSEAAREWNACLSSPHCYEPEATRSCFISVIVEEEHPKILGRLLHMLAQQTSKTFEVIVVRQTSAATETEGVRTVVSQAADRADRLNEGAAQAKGSHLLFLDEDDVIEPDMIEVLAFVSARADAPILSSITGWSTRNDNSIIAVGRQKARVQQDPAIERHILVAWIPYGPFLTTNLWENILGEAVLIEKDCFVRLGGLNKKHGLFPLWGFLTRAALQNIPFLMVPEVIVSFARNKQKYTLYSEKILNARLAVLQITLETMPVSLRPAVLGLLGKHLNIFPLPGETQIQDGTDPAKPDNAPNPFAEDAPIVNASASWRDQPPQVVFCASESYKEPLAVALASLWIASPKVDVHIVTTMSETSKARLRKLAAHWGQTLRFVTPEKDKLPKLPASNLWGMGEDETTFLRICLPELLPELSRVIYLDADILVRHDIAGLWHMDLEGKPLGAVVESPFATAANPIESMSELFAKHFKGAYFNGGVLMLDLVLWRKNKYAQTVLALSDRLEKEGDIYKFGDQSPLNLAFQNNWRHLPPSWNFSPYVEPRFSKGHKLAGLDHKTYLKIHQDPALVHFLGSFKPWDIKDDKADVFVREYMAYANVVLQLL